MMKSACVVAACLILGGCGSGKLAVADIPDLPTVDERLLKARKTSPCIKDKSPDVSVRTLVKERDCFETGEGKAVAHLNALQSSVRENNEAIEKLRKRSK